MPGLDELERVEITSAGELRAWLEAHHTQSESVWLVTYKKHAGSRYVSVGEVLDELLCFGWVDGVRRKLDDDRTMQLVSPRKTQHWAASYKDRIAALERGGRMHDAGRRAVETAKASGAWTFMDDVDALVVPDDLRESLAAQDAVDRFEGLAPAYRRNLLRWIKLAKSSPTRRKRIDEVVASTASGEKLPNF